MMNLHNKKTKRIVASVIVIILVVAMIVPLVLAYLA